MRIALWATLAWQAWHLRTAGEETETLGYSRLTLDIHVERHRISVITGESVESKPLPRTRQFVEIRIG